MYVDSLSVERLDMREAELSLSAESDFGICEPGSTVIWEELFDKDSKARALD
jgi:hypothetical protein